MKDLILSTGLNYAPYSKKETAEYIREGMKVLKRTGFEAIDFDTCILSAAGNKMEEYIELARQTAEELGLTFGQCHLPFVPQKKGTPDELASFNATVFSAIDAANRLGIPYAVVHPNSTTVPLEGYDRQAEYDNVMHHLSPFVEYANKAGGVQIVIENMRFVHQSYPAHRFCADPEELCSIADALGIGVCWDTGHAHITGLKQSEAIQYVGNRLKVIHLNDNLADDDIHLPPFLGSVDWADTMKGLSAIGYSGTLNFEIATGHIPADARETFGQYLHAAARHLLTLI